MLASKGVEVVPHSFTLMDPLGNTPSNEVPHRGASCLRINEFPIEILILIFSNLAPVDLKDLRLVCRKWNDAVLDKSAWTNAFNNKFGTEKVFPTVTRSPMWLAEYFGRVATLRRWAKAKPFAHLYQLLNSEYGAVDHVRADFVHDRILTFSRASASVSMCTLTLGKNQAYVPDNYIFTGILSYDANWNYLCVGKTTGEVYVKNLITATSSGSSRLSVTTLGECGLPAVGVNINPECDKRKEKADVVVISNDGTLHFWTLAGKICGSLKLQGVPMFLKTDFCSHVVVVTHDHIHVVDFATHTLLLSRKHGWNFNETEFKVICHFDLHDNNVVICHLQKVKVFHFDDSAICAAEATTPSDVHIIDGTMQESFHKRNPNIAGGDGLLYALTLSDGSVTTFNIRGVSGTIAMNARIYPFADGKSPQGVAEYTKVALNSTVIAIGAFADWIHFYDAHSGQYLREGTKIARKWVRFQILPILAIQFGPTGACGIVISGNVVQYFRFGDTAPSRKKPNAPAGSDASTRKAKQQHIKAQIEEYDAHQHQQQQQELMADKYNGTVFDDEQEELRVAIALSASYAHTRDDDLLRALALLEQTDPEDELQEALALSASQNHIAIHGMSESFNEASGAREGLSSSEPTPTVSEDSEEEILQRVLKLSMLEH